MTLQFPQTWEYQLLSRAEEGLKDQNPSPYIQADSQILDAAYHQCEVITRVHSRTFYLASALLPSEKRRAVRSLYAFCRVTDNIADSPTDDRIKHSQLVAWQQRVMNGQSNSDDPILLAWAATKARYSIPSGYAEQLITGVMRDLKQKRYQTFAELAEYSYGVASTVGLMAMHIIGFSGEEALPYAVKLGVALQITNILRDVGEDWRVGRLYLPLEELESFGLDGQTIAAGQVTDRWREFMRFQINRNRRLYIESLPGIALLNPEGRFAIAAAAQLYQAILSDIEQHDYNVFNRRAQVSTIGKLTRLPGIWWRSHGNHSVSTQSETMA
jgi:15-cis-phytoene synthase